jgi:hypothetical protein
MERGWGEVKHETENSSLLCALCASPENGVVKKLGS